MSKQVRRICDVCGEDLFTHDYYKFKNINWDYSLTRFSHKLEMCSDCFEKFKRYVQQNKKSTEPKPPKGKTAMQDF